MIKFLTICAHPVYGTAQPGQIQDVSEEFAAQLIEGRYAVQIEEEVAAGKTVVVESAALQTPEQAMLPSAQPRKRESRKG